MDSIVWKNKQNCDTLPLNMTMMMMMMMMMDFDFASKLPKTASQHCNLHMCLKRCLNDHEDNDDEDDNDDVI